ncbi:hypothetical protein [Nonomuraea sp. GTA35]|uniref:hypothetical protein n=1 Tax=Nonomuraea sp. GTA35 TaxID=1676746 RepID=UPI0035C04478
MLNDQAEERRRRRRGLALRISALLVGVLHLVLAAVLIALPGSSPSLDPLPPDTGGETADEARTGRPVVAISPHSASAPAEPTTSGPVEPTASGRPSTVPQAATAPSIPQTSPRSSRSPVRERGAVPPSEGAREASRTAPASTPTTGKTKAARPTRTPSPAVAPSSEHVPPGQTREPPGRVQGNGPTTPPGHDK